MADILFNERKPYKIYRAVITQTGTSAPVATVFENTLGGTPVWTRVSAGFYKLTLAGKFTVDKTVTPMCGEFTGNAILAAPIFDDATTIGQLAYYNNNTGDCVQLDVSDNAGVFKDISDIIDASTIPITILVYP